MLRRGQIVNSNRTGLARSVKSLSVSSHEYSLTETPLISGHDLAKPPASRQVSKYASSGEGFHKVQMYSCANSSQLQRCLEEYSCPSTLSYPASGENERHPRHEGHEIPNWRLSVCVTRVALTMVGRIHRSVWREVSWWIQAHYHTTMVPGIPCHVRASDRGKQLSKHFEISRDCEMRVSDSNRHIIDCAPPKTTKLDGDQRSSARKEHLRLLRDKHHSPTIRLLSLPNHCSKPIPPQPCSARNCHG